MRSRSADFAMSSLAEISVVVRDGRSLKSCSIAASSRRSSSRSGRCSSAMISGEFSMPRKAAHRRPRALTDCVPSSPDMFWDSATVISFLRKLRIETCRKEHGCGVNQAAAGKKQLRIALFRMWISNSANKEIQCQRSPDCNHEPADHARRQTATEHHADITADHGGCADDDRLRPTHETRHHEQYNSNQLDQR